MSIGDSVICIGDLELVKVHVHTDQPGKALTYALELGELDRPKIENMLEQNRQIKAKMEAEKKEMGMLAICTGTGLADIFKDLSVDRIIEGGQTMNPSASDIATAAQKINAEHIFVFPNNGNIIMAASQAAEIYENAKVYVIPSKSVGAGYVAMSSMNFDSSSTDQLISEAEDAIGRITSAYISPAVRDADMNGVHINNGDTIGIINKEIVLSDPDRRTAANKIASMLLGMPDKFMLTVFCGEDSSEDENAILQKHMEENHPEVELCFIEGGQAIYPYIFVAE
jgi:dihydroxyacetone kinase-like predicted kinase